MMAGMIRPGQDRGCPFRQSTLRACSIPALRAPRAWEVKRSKLLPEPFDPQDLIVDRASRERVADEQALHVASTSGGEQQMLGFDRGVAHHARLVFGQQDQVVGLVGEPAQRVRRPGDRDAGISARATAVTA